MRRAGFLVVLVGVVASATAFAVVLGGSIETGQSAAPSAALTGTVLPREVAEAVDSDEASLADVWSELEDVERLKAHLTVAESVLARRRIYQSDGWWQVVDARYQVTSLQHLLLAEPLARGALNQALAARARLGDLYAKGEFEQAIRLARQIVDAAQRVFGEDHPLVAEGLTSVASLHDALHQIKEADAAESQARDISRRVFGQQHPIYAERLNRLADRTAKQRSAQRSGRTEGLLLEALAIRLTTLGQRDPQTAANLHQLAHLYLESGRYGDAEPLYRLALALRLDLLGPRDADYASTLNDLGLLLGSTGRYGEAEPLYREALAIFDPSTRDGADASATIIDNLAGLHRARGQYADAEERYLEALALRQGLPDESQRATTLNNLAVLYTMMGRFDDAESRCRESLRLVESSGMTSDRLYASTLDTLSAITKSRGRYEEAEPGYLRALDIRRNALGENHPDVALSYNNLGNLVNLKGDLPGAEAYYRRARDTWRRTAGERHVSYAIATANLAEVVFARGQTADAEPLFEEALRGLRETGSQAHAAYVAALNNLAGLCGSTGRKERAEQLYLEGIATVKQALGERAPSLATLQNNLADLYVGMHAYDRAEALYRQALAIRETAVGTEHPAYASSLAGVGSALAAEGRAEAARYLLDSARVDWQHLTRNFPTMSPARKQTFLKHSAFNQSERLITLAVHGTLASPQDALEGVLLTKQLLLEVARRESAALLDIVDLAPQDWQSLWRERSDLRRRYVEQALHGEGGSEPAAMLNRIDDLEQELRRRNTEYGQLARLQRITMADVSRALTPRDALVEYVAYRPYDFAEGVPSPDEHYAAFVKRGDGAPVAAFDLGSAKDINDQVSQVRGVVENYIAYFKNTNVDGDSASKRRSKESDTAQAAATLGESIWSPLQKSLERIERVYIAPDGPLSLIPFEVLARQTDEGGWRYLVEDLEILYVGTARDLGRFALDRGTPRHPRTVVLVGDPDFDTPPLAIAATVAAMSGDRVAPGQPAKRVAAPKAAAPAAAPHERPCVDARKGVWQRAAGLADLLVATRTQLAGLGYSVSLLERETAVEEAVLGVRAPQILQVATHGHYAPDIAEGCQGEWVNPLVKSMLILAGTNVWSREAGGFYRLDRTWLREDAPEVRALQEAERRQARVEIRDGVLTAYEVSGLNLRGTELVNLTACHTGQGDPTPDGIAGLRQSFLLAGARSVTMSMWEVPAIETSQQIADFYARWLKTAEHNPNRYVAFRQAQLEALRKARAARQTGHPFYWAGSIYVGDPGDLPATPAGGDPLRADSRLAAVRNSRSARR